MKSFLDDSAAVHWLASELSRLLSERGEDGTIPTAISERLRLEPFRVLVLGEFSRGKSTFLNALAGERLLPSSVRPTTAVISVIRNGDERSAHIYWHAADRPPLRIDLPASGAAEALESVVTEKNAQWNEVATVEISVPLRNFPLSLSIELIDTPGVNDIDPQREEVTYRYLPRADAAILLLDLHQPVSASERLFLEEQVLGNDVRKILFVLNKIDQESPENLEKGLAYVRKRLSEIRGCESSDLLAVSAKRALKARLDSDERSLEESRMPLLESRLLEFLEDGSGRGRVQTSAARLLRIARSEGESLVNAESALAAREADLTAIIAAARTRISSEAVQVRELEESVGTSLTLFQTKAGGMVNTRIREAKVETVAITQRASFPCEDDLSSVREAIARTARDLVDLPRRAAVSVLGPRAAPLPTSESIANAPEFTQQADVELDPVAIAVGVTVIVAMAAAFPIGLLAGGISGFLASIVSAGKAREKAATAAAEHLNQAQQRAIQAIAIARGELSQSMEMSLLAPAREDAAKAQRDFERLTAIAVSDSAQRARGFADVRRQLDRVRVIEAELTQIVESR